MTTHTRQESYGPHHRTFDCPWCGAISGVPPDLIGDVFQCPECKETTKLTVQNTRAAHLSETPPGAPHHAEGELTFDCPWCGAISPVSSEALGTSFACPECKNETRLTEKTTRRAELFVPPPGAPHHEERHGLPGWVFGALAVLAVAVIAWAAFGNRGDEGGGAAGTVAQTPTTANGGTPAGPAPSDAPEPSEAAPPASAPDSSPDPVPPPKEDPALLAAREKVAAAEREVAAAESALEAWMNANADRLALAQQHEAATALQDLLTAQRRALEEGAPTPAAMQASNRKLAAAIEADPLLAKIAEGLWQTLRSVPFRPVRAESWKDLNFLAPGFAEVLADRVQSGRLQLPAEHDALRAAVAEARKTLDGARRTLTDLEAPSEEPDSPR